MGKGIANMKVFADNRKAYHDYTILEKLECGISLVGPEVKSIRAGKLNLKDSYCEVKNGQLILRQSHISAYKEGSYNNEDPMRDRVLLAHKLEILRLSQKVAEKGLTLVPLKVYSSVQTGGKIKVEVGLAKGKHSYDKRAALKEKDIKRDMDRGDY